MTDHLDPGYAAAARRRAEAAERAEGTEGTAPAPHGRVALAVGLALVGFLLAIAYRGTLRQAPDSERARQALVQDVEDGSALSDGLQRRAETLSGQLVRERDAALAASRNGDRASTEVRRLEAAAALVAVTGPGVEVVVGDAGSREQLDPATGQRVTVPAEDNGRLRDRDLQSLVNALWSAGAEAVAVDGERLAPTTTIRAAGEAILVDLRPVQNPYTIAAIGDPATLLPRFADSEAARRYQSYTGLYGIQFTVRRAGELRLRPATGTDPRYAEEVPESSSAPMPSSAPSRSGPASAAPTPSGSPSGFRLPSGSTPAPSWSPTGSRSPSGPAPSWSPSGFGSSSVSGPAPFWSPSDPGCSSGPAAASFASPSRPGSSAGWGPMSSRSPAGPGVSRSASGQGSSGAGPSPGVRPVAGAFVSRSGSSGRSTGGGP